MSTYTGIGQVSTWGSRMQRPHSHPPGTTASQGTSRVSNRKALLPLGIGGAWPDLRILFPHTGVKDSSFWPQTYLLVS